jgi:hypothetical protein
MTFRPRKKGGPEERFPLSFAVMPTKYAYIDRL